MPKPISHLASRVQAPADWIIPRLLKRRNTLFLIGEPKLTAKSWMLFNLGWDLADGANVWGVTHSKDGDMLTPTRAMRVLYFAQEDTEDDLQDRFMLMTSAGRIPNDNLMYETKDLNFAFGSSSGEERIYASVAAAAPVDLVMFDPMRRMHYFDENDSEAIARFWRAINMLQAKFDCACAFSHHVTKPSKEGGVARHSPHAARGSGDIFGGADAFVNVVPRARRGNPQQGFHTQPVDLHFETKRSAPLSPIGLSVNFGTGLVSFDGFK